MYPIHIGADQDFACVRELLRRADFSEAALARVLDIHDLDGAEATARRQEAVPEPSDTLGLLIRLFVQGLYVREESFPVLLSARELEALQNLGLLAHGAASGKYFSPVKLYPVGPVHVACDRWSNPDGSPFQSFPDIIYPPVGPNTRLFLSLLPEAPCETLLDLCSGTGVAGLIAASRYARRAFAFDIAERSTHFAEFNRRLNDLPNLSALTGDLFEPAGGEKFERIVAHPPYVPVLESKWVFHDGGEDGEQVTRRMIAALPRYLENGGALYCLTLVTDREGEPLEDRIRGWLGESHTEFDLAVVVFRNVDPTVFAVDSIVRGIGKVGDSLKWEALFRKLKVSGLVYAMIIIERKTRARAAFTARRQAGPKTTRAEHAWLLEWESAAAEPGSDSIVLDSRVKASERCELLVLNRIQDGDWVAARCKLQIDFPFGMEMEMEPWIGHLLPLCDGSRTGQGVFEELRRREVLHPDTPVQEFAGVLKGLVSGGFLQLARGERQNTGGSATASTG